jgi:hypothetical protein
VFSIISNSSLKANYELLEKLCQDNIEFRNKFNQDDLAFLKEYLKTSYFSHYFGLKK